MSLKYTVRDSDVRGGRVLSSLKQWFLKFRMHQKYPENLVKSSVPPSEFLLR